MKILENVWMTAFNFQNNQKQAEKKRMRMNDVILLQGDCFELMKDIPNGSADLVVTDPPYGIDFVSNFRKEKFKSIKNDNSLIWLGDFIDELYRILKENTAVYCFCSWHNIDVFKTAFEKKFKVKNIIVWEKNNTSMGDLRGSYAPKYELVIYAHKGRRILNGFRYADIIKAKRTGNKHHPTEKPIDLLEIFINESSNEGDIVFDPFMGSGPTGIACVKTGRKFIGMELDENYFEIAQKRIEKAQKEGNK